MMTTSARSISTDQRVLVTFRLERQLYALPIAPIVQIIEMVAVTPLPQVHAAIKGVINWHGTLAPAIDLRSYLGLPDALPGADTHIILTQVGGRLAGLIVDQVLDVLHLSAQQVIHPADILPLGLNATPPMIEGLARTPDGMVLLLELEQLVAHSSLNLAAVSSVLAAQSAAQSEPLSSLTLNDLILEPAA
jgi:purine-binding chemotaxis protein CheW